MSDAHRSVAELMNLEGRRVLLTGGAGKLGTAMAEAFVELGAHVALLDLPISKPSAAADALATKSGQTALGIPCDLEDEASVDAAAAAALTALGGLDVLVHCAAFVGTTGLTGWGVPLADQTASTWRRAIEVNLTATFVLTQACREALLASGHGSIIFIGSIYGVVGPDMGLYEGLGMGNPAAYAASKGGNVQFARWLATVMAPKVRVNVISPGGVWRGQPEEFVERYTKRTPLARMATEEDIKGAAVFLASDMSAYVTGQNLMLDGGFTAW